MSAEDELEALGGVSLADFLEARKQRAAALRKAGDKVGAARIAACPKPTPAAWAVNQLWRTRRADVEALMTLGADLREALRRSLAGSGDARAMGALQQRQRAAIEPLAAEARRLLENAGAPASDVVLERVGTTLGAISTTGAWGEAAPGQLGKELGAPDLATIAAMLGTPPVAAPVAGRSEHEEAAEAATGPARARAARSAVDVAAAERQREEERLSRVLLAEGAVREARDWEVAAADTARAAAEVLAEAVTERRVLAAELATAMSLAGDRAREAEEARHRAEDARREVDALALRSAASARTEAGAVERQERAETEAKAATRAREVAEAALGALAARG